MNVGEQSLYPDAYLQLQRQYQVFNYFVEVDCGTEPVVSHKNRESLTRKIRFYDDYSKQGNDPFRVLFVFASPLRRSNFLDAAYEYMTPPYNRTIFLATMLPDDTVDSNLVTDSVFQDHRRNFVSLAPSRIEYTPKKKSELVAATCVG